MEQKLNKLIVTEWNGQIWTALMTDGKCRSLQVEEKEERSILGNIYIGKVKNLVKNINAAFIDLGGGRTGYYSLSENSEHGNVRVGEELVVQVSRDAVKSKDPVVTSNLNFTGKYLVLTLGKTQLGFSSKIKNSGWKQETREWLEPRMRKDYGLIVRTNAEGMMREVLESELVQLEERLDRILTQAPNRTCYSLLESSLPSYIQGIRDSYSDTLGEILTDVPELYEQMKAYLLEEQCEDQQKLRFHEDKKLPLFKLYSLESVLEGALSKRVWLKSGGYLVIEPTEALTVIDVNTGKYTGKKTVEETILKINLEAATETARQLCLRNLSGIIIIDFIDMNSEENKKQLLSCLEAELRKDPVKTVLVDMTKLGLVELTRKKVRRPLHESLGISSKE